MSPAEVLQEPLGNTGMISEDFKEFLYAMLLPCRERSILLTARQSDGICDGMKTMTHRTTFALDKKTAGNLKKLSRSWRVSQAEVVRRAVAEAVNRNAFVRPDPLEALESLHSSGDVLDAKTAEQWALRVREDRAYWGFR